MAMSVGAAQETASGDSVEVEKKLGGEFDREYELEAVTTIGTRSAERIIDLPYSVFSVDSKELSFGRKTSAKDVLADVPGMFLQSLYGNHDLRITLRGFGTRSNSGSRAVRILVDGIPESDPDGETALDAIDFTSLGGVEVAKGNLSSLYANAPGGVINFQLDKYFPKNYVGTITQIGSYGLAHQGVRLGVENPQNRLFLTYNYSNLDGYRQHNQEYINLLNFAYEAYLAERTSIGVYGNYVDALIKLPGPLTKEEFETDPFQASTVGISQDMKRITNKGRVGVRYNTSFGSGFQNEVEVTVYGAFKDFERADATTYAYAQRQTLGGWGRFTNRSPLFGQSNTLTVGVDYAHQSGPLTDFENIAGHRDISVQNEYIDGLNNLGVYLVNRHSVVDEKLDLFLSVRFDHNSFTRDIYVPFGFTDTNRVFDKFAPKVGLNCKLSPVVALYSSYGISYDIPALNEMGNTPISSNISYSLNPDLNPQKSDNFEVGIKGNLFKEDEEFMKKIVFDVTFFDYIIKDEIIPFVINQKQYYRNAAKTRRTGVEVGFKCEPIEELEMVVNYTYTNFRYKDYYVTEFTPSGQVEANYSGNTVPSVPQSLVNFILFYKVEISEDLKGLILWDSDYVSRMFVNDGNTETAPEYFYGNILLGLDIALDGMGFVVYGGMHNILDRRYAGYINVNDFDGRYYETGEPRASYGGLKINWGF